MKTKFKLIIILAVLIIHIFLMTGLSMIKHYNLLSDFDLSQNERIVHNSINGDFFYFDIDNSEHLGIHVNLIYIFIFPFYFLFPKTMLLFFLQSLSFAIGAFFIYKICQKKKFQFYQSLIITILYLFSANNFFVNLEEFHPVVFAVPFLIMSIYFSFSKNIKFMILAMIGFILVKENMVFTLFFIGIYFLIMKRKRLFVITSTIAIIYFIILISFFPSSYLSFLNERYSFENKPFLDLKLMTDETHLNYFSSIIISTAIISLLNPLSIVGIPIFFQNYLSNEGFQHCFLGHHSIVLFSILFISLIFALKKTQKYNKTIFKISFILFIFCLIIFNIKAYGLTKEINNYQNTIFSNCIINERSGSNLLLIFKLKDNINYIQEFNNIPKDKKLLLGSMTASYFSNYKEIANINIDYNKEKNYYDYIILSQDVFKGYFPILKELYPGLTENILEENKKIIIYST